MQTQSQQHQPQPVLGGSDDLRYHGTELVMLYDYKVNQRKYRNIFIVNCIHAIDNNFYRYVGTSTG